MGNGTLSVTMPNYNHAHYIGEAIESILSQSFRPLEVIVVDDGSTDNSVAIIEQFARRDPTVRLLQNEQNMGSIFSVNRALEHASGDYVCFQSADDKVLPGFFEKSMRLLGQYPQAGICSSRVLLINEQGREVGEQEIVAPIETAGFLPPKRVLAELRKRGGYIIGCSAIIKRTALLEFGGLIPELRSFGDWFIQNAIALKYGACFIPEPLAAWRRMDTGYSASISVRTDIVLEVVSYAVKLMQSSKYSSLFPQDCVRNWERKQLHILGRLILKRLWNHQGDFFADLESLRPHPTILDKTFLKGLRLWMRAQSLAIKLYLVYRDRGWLLLVRTLKRKMKERWMHGKGGSRD
ncbi:glycosyltransferase family 2 protein [bacterium]|nr:glycosyltransferase family 2 protein [bacterium]